MGLPYPRGLPPPQPVPSGEASQHGPARVFGHKLPAGGESLSGRVVAIGIPGISAVSAVGTFLPGGPIHDNPKFAAFTNPGRVLDPTRILVGSNSNFAAPLANNDQDEGSFISIDPSGSAVLVIPPDFAMAGNQASALAGKVQMFSAQSPNP